MLSTDTEHYQGSVKSLHAMIIKFKWVRLKIYSYSKSLINETNHEVKHKRYSFFNDKIRLIIPKIRELL